MILDAKSKSYFAVIPAHAGIHSFVVMILFLDSGFHRSDKWSVCFAFTNINFRSVLGWTDY
jgi:hypothetical protein